ncbi:hypothetical protein L596_029481 [Steinernema carpocapsae]|uniref:Peptidase S1 domain-containing protein n=1 Tax=Steinernema carpocapsae TaxID=34508 RepID=A0A4U5LUS5_STECR|nr:hypothetical protein L596_029481 [Steinernema carpocapsae]
MRLVAFLFTVSFVFSQASREIDPELLTLVPPGYSPTISKISESENKEIQRICGYDDRAKGRHYKISGGQKPPTGRFPWAVAFTLPADYEQQSYCGGTIISRKHVLSAAHCFFDYSNDGLPCKNPTVKYWNFQSVVHYGGTCSRPGRRCNAANTRTTTIKKIHHARKFNEDDCSRGFDFAIVEIEGKFKFDDNAKPICIPKPHRNDSELNDYSVFTNVGYGQDEAGRRSDSLGYIDFNQRSVNIAGFKDVVIVVPELAIKGICPGDSGSGFQATRKTDGRNYFLGIHSTGMPCGYGDHYASTYVPFYTKAICKHTGVCPQ